MKLETLWKECAFLGFRKYAGNLHKLNTGSYRYSYPRQTSCETFPQKLGKNLHAWCGSSHYL
jgi:hypothetical protein